jgi:hypothetical protein
MVHGVARRLSDHRPLRPRQMTLQSRREAIRKNHAKRALTGERKATFWLSERARDRVKTLASDAGTSKDAQVERAILMAPSVGQVEGAPYVVSVDDDLVSLSNGLIVRRAVWEARDK